MEGSRQINLEERLVEETPTSTRRQRRSSPLCAPAVASHGVELCLESFDSTVCLFEVLIEAVSLGNEMRLPLTEARLLELDLLCEAAAQGLLLLAVLWVVELLDLWLTELASLHLLLPVVLVVSFLCRGDQVEHMGADEEGSQLLEIAMLLVFDLGHTPQIVASLDQPSVSCLHVFCGAYDGEGHGAHERLCVLRARRVVCLDGWRVNSDTLAVDDLADTLLKDGEVLWAEGVCFCDDGDKVDAGAEALHDFNV